MDPQQTVPWYRNERGPPPIKSRAPLQRQLSAGQTSLLSSHSGITVGIRNVDMSGFQMVKKRLERLGCKLSGVRFGAEIGKPNHLKSE